MKDYNLSWAAYRSNLRESIRVCRRPRVLLKLLVILGVFSLSFGMKDNTIPAVIAMSAGAFVIQVEILRGRRGPPP